MTKLLPLLLCLAATPVAAQGLHFGTNIARPGQIVHFTAPVTAKAQGEVTRAGRPFGFVRGALVLPAACTNLSRPCPLLVVSVPSGGSAISWLPAVTNVALSEGWAVLAAGAPVKIPAEEDTIQFGWALLSCVLDQFTKTWPMTKQWPVACAGFSGGAKRSAAVAAAMTRDGWRVIGVFMGGCNEDRATLGQQLFQPGPLFKRVPMFLSNGDGDPIANPGHGAAVRDSMIASGFTTVRLERFPGKHQLHREHLRDALQWFERLADSQRPASGGASGSAVRPNRQP